MYTSRYSADPLVDGKILGTNAAIQKIRNAIENRLLTTRTLVLAEPDRLDNVAARVYGDGRLWWVIAAASGIGWWFQVPAGSRIVYPVDIKLVMGLIQ